MKTENGLYYNNFILHRISEPSSWICLSLFAILLQIMVRTMLRKRSFGNPFDLGRKDDRNSLCAAGQTLR